jgi:uncharacterized membrane protein YhaH (DUF805 family)
MGMTQLLFSFQGRLNRKFYWTIVIATTVVFILVLLLALAALREYGLEFLPVTIAIILVLYIPLIGSVSLLAPSVSTIATSPHGGSSCSTRCRQF